MYPTLNFPVVVNNTRQGLFTLRLQLKSLRFESASLVSLLALLAPHATTEGETTAGTARRPDATELPPKSSQTTAQRPRGLRQGKLRGASVLDLDDVSVDGDDIVEGGGVAASAEDVVFAAAFHQTEAMQARGVPSISTPYPSSSVPIGDAYGIKEVEEDWRAAGPGLSALNLGGTRSSSSDLSLERQRWSSTGRKWKEYRPITATPHDLYSTAIHARGQPDMAKVDIGGKATAFGAMGDGVEGRARTATGIALGLQHDGLAELQLRLGMGTPALRWSLLQVLRCVSVGARCPLDHKPQAWVIVLGVPESMGIC